MIVARGKNGVIGREGDLPWRLRDDMANFKATTLDKPVIMGRSTWDSLPKKPLPGRENIVLSRNWSFEAEGARVYSSLSVALNVARSIAERCDSHEAVIIGGATIYEAAMPFVDRIYLTEVDAAPEGDVLFPKLDEADWREVRTETFAKNDRNEFAFTIRQLERV